MTRPPTLYHYTCSDHGLTGITASGVIRPNPHVLIPRLGPVVWLTSLAELTDPDAVGLARNEHSRLPCDRTAHRFTVHTKAAKPWAEVRHLTPPEVLEILESYADPSTWWVARRPILRSEWELSVTVTQ